MIQDLPTHNLFPKFKAGKGRGNFINSDNTTVMSNYYAIQLKKQFKAIYQYSVDFQPQLPSDATKISQKLIQSIKRELRSKIGFICFKGRMIWGNQNSQLAVVTKTTIQVKGQKQQYELIIKPNTSITVEDFITKDQANLTKLSQVFNVNTKNVLKNIGFKQLDRGKYYNGKDFQKEIIGQAGLSVWRGYQVNLVSIGNKLFLRADVCSRVLRTQSFLETMKLTNKIKDKNYINQTFKQNSVITRYGNHRIFRIFQIDYTMSPKSTFNNTKSQKKQTFIEYYSSVYQCTIKQTDQPLIKVIVKNCEKEEVQYLIPELVCLTGLTDSQRADFNLMKSVNQKTKLRVDQRVEQTSKIVRMLNKDESKQLMYQIQQKAQQFSADIAGAPNLTIGNKKLLMPKDGSMNLRDPILDPIHLKKYYFVYTSRGERDEEDADATLDYLQKASKAFGIKLDKPNFINIKAKRGQRLTAKDWIYEIQEQIKYWKQQQIKKGNKQATGLPQFVIAYFNNDEKKDAKLYQNLKSHLIHKLHLNSQVITKRTLSAGAKGAMAKASKILLQINDKMGHPLYRVEKQHPFWGKNTIAIGSLAVSAGPKGYIASFVGTRNNQLTQKCSDFHKVDKKQVLPEAVLSSFISGWLKQYYKTQGKKLPSTLIIYREGLNEKQAQKVLLDELKTLEKTFQDVSSKAKVSNWKPKVIYLLVSQKTGTRAYEIDRNRRLSNPLPGTIIGSEMSKDGSYEFLMASAATTEGTCNMVQYKVAYDSSNQEIPHEALKIITYEQCYNYPNWAGSIRFPATLQMANKLAKFVSTHGESNIQKTNPLKGLDYYI